MFFSTQTSGAQCTVCLNSNIQCAVLVFLNSNIQCAVLGFPQLKHPVRRARFSSHARHFPPIVLALSTAPNLHHVVGPPPEVREGAHKSPFGSGPVFRRSVTPLPVQVVFLQFFYGDTRIHNHTVQSSIANHHQPE